MTDSLTLNCGGVGEQAKLPSPGQVKRIIADRVQNWGESLDA